MEKSMAYSGEHYAYRKCILLRRGCVLDFYMWLVVYSKDTCFVDNNCFIGWIPIELYVTHSVGVRY